MLRCRKIFNFILKKSKKLMATYLWSSICSSSFKSTIAAESSAVLPTISDKISTDISEFCKKGWKNSQIGNPACRKMKFWRKIVPISRDILKPSSPKIQWSKQESALERIYFHLKSRSSWFSEKCGSVLFIFWWSKKAKS